MMGGFDFSISDWPRPPKRSGLLVTATDTDAGKTLIAGAIARTFHEAGKRVGVFKPVASGCVRRDNEWCSTDGEFLAKCAGGWQAREWVAPVCLSPALSPNVAAVQMGQKIELGKIFKAYQQLAACQPDVTIVEGVGGLLCPITDDFWVIHFARMLDLPLVIVARAGLGTINHTLLTIHAARSAGLRVAGVVINRYVPDSLEGDAATSMRTNPEQIEKRGKVKVLAMLPEDSQSDVEAGILGHEIREAVAAVNWAALI